MLLENHSSHQWHLATLQYSGLENPMDGGAWWAAVHGVARSRTRLSDFTFTFLHWRRKWQPTPVFLPGESQGRGSLVGCRLWGRTESDTTEATSQQQQQHLKRLWDRLLCPSPYRWGNWDSREVTACSWGALWDRSLIQVYLVPGSKFSPLTFSNLKCGPFHDIHLHDLEI